MRGARVGAAVAAAAVASAGWACSPTPSPNRRTPMGEQVVRVVTPNEDLQLTLSRSEVAFADSVPAVDPERAWQELPAVYAALGLPVNGLDPAVREIRVSGFALRRVEGRRPSSFLDCGRGPTVTSYADSYQLSLDMTTRVYAHRVGSGIQTVVRATARPRDVSAQPLPCHSLGTLEKRVSELLRARAAGGVDG